MGFKASAVPGPLNGIVVLDLTRVLAGPYCTMVLADLGARVIKVENPATGDDSRHVGPFVADKSAYFMSINRGKESIALDLKNAGDRELFERLLGQVDVLVENFRGGTMEKLGYGFEGLHRRYPRLIYAAASGFGHTGPYMQRAAYDLVVQGMGGVMSLTGHPGGPPTRVGTSIGDITAGLFCTIGIASALHHRGQTGKGLKVDVAMLDCQVAILENAIARYTATGEVPGPLGARHPSITPFEAFQTADSYIIVVAGNDSLFRTLSKTIGRPDLQENPLFRTNPDRTRHHAALKDELELTFRSDTTAHWLDLLGRAGVPCSPINDVAQVLEDPQVKSRNMLCTVDDPRVGRVSMAGNPIKLSAFHDPAMRPPAPDLDQDRAALLAELAEAEAAAT